MVGRYLAGGCWNLVDAVPGNPRPSMQYCATKTVKDRGPVDC